MSYSVEKLDNKPIIIATLNEDFDFATEAERATREGIALLEAASEPVHYITDLRQASFSVTEMMSGSSMAARGENPVFHHRNVKNVVFVTGDKAQRLSAAGMSTDLYGNLNIEIFEDLENALTSIEATDNA